jgi:hypothetical protein
MRTIYSIGIYGTLNKATIIDENYTIPRGYGESFLCKADSYSHCWTDTEKEAWELYLEYLDNNYEKTLEEIQDLEKYRDEILEKKRAVQEKLIELSS